MESAPQTQRCTTPTFRVSKNGETYVTACQASLSAKSGDDPR
jgi:hypothetical protein